MFSISVNSCWFKFWTLHQVLELRSWHLQAVGLDFGAHRSIWSTFDRQYAYDLHMVQAGCRSRNQEENLCRNWFYALASYWKIKRRFKPTLFLNNTCHAIFAARVVSSCDGAGLDANPLLTATINTYGKVVMDCVLRQTRCSDMVFQ